MPRYRENPLIIPFSMLCPGISQNTKLHHLTLYKGQVWGEKSYLELCNHNVLTVLFDPLAIKLRDTMEENSTLDVPPVPGQGFINEETLIPYDSEILQSFAELTNITNMTFHSFDSYEDSLKDVTYQLLVGSFKCHMQDAGRMPNDQCVHSLQYYTNYIWTKEGFNTNKIIQI